MTNIVKQAIDLYKKGVEVDVINTLLDREFIFVNQDGELIKVLHQERKQKYV